MKRSLQMLMWVVLVCVATSCANKGKLMSPSQMAAQQEKKERRAAAKAQKEAKEADKDDADQEAKPQEDTSLPANQTDDQVPVAAPAPPDKK